jgi:hypothetical protein
MSKPSSKQELLIENLKKRIDYKYDCYEASINDVSFNLYGKSWSVALQLSLLNALSPLLKIESNQFDMGQWIKFTMGLYNDKDFKIFNGKNPIKQLTIRVRDPNADDIDSKIFFKKHKAFKELGYKALQVFVSLENSMDEYDFLIMGQNYGEVTKQFDRWINQFIYDLSRPVNEVIGQDLDNAIRSKPGGDVLQIYLSTILGSPFFLKEKLPDGRVFNKGEKRISIPYPKQLSYQEIRNACGGNNGIYWGHYHTRGFIIAKDSRSLKECRQLVVSGDTKESSESNYERFLRFTNGIEVNRTYGENSYKYDDVKKLKMKRFLVYPKHVFIEKTAYLNLSNPNLLEGDKATNQTLQGKKISRKYKIFIYSENESPDFKEAMKVLAY